MNKKIDTKKMALGALLTALVIILQLFATMFEIPTSMASTASALSLVPIVIGAALCGLGVAGWLGLVFAAVVLISGSASFFMGIHAFGTIVTVLVKGVACGLVSGLVYKLAQKFNKVFAAFAAAIACPVVNTGIYFIGCALFFAKEIGMSVLFFGALPNFFLELGISIVIAPVIVTLIDYKSRVK